MTNYPQWCGQCHIKTLPHHFDTGHVPMTLTQQAQAVGSIENK